ncbi:tetratricopeptide repeat protein [Actinomadura decatromicini]|uniref:Tetratricopeptide repeat protein n=1 Tax=Actinomadura decatromicini TaxID=2604572 RepID=A0A5D3FDN5_9ACTN|nr:tetratricopeptide repeat protein [Actinomadura decatromicini]TYK47017.1 tetratricopeptide repeat protein [Actinomadura decatromicini]
MAPAPAARLAVREAALAQARTLARAGRYTEAAELLGGEHDVAVLDLRARIHAQQGRWDEADRCWAEAAALAPGDRSAAEGRRRIAEIRARAARPGRVRVARGAVRAGGALAALLALAMLADLWLDRADTPGRVAVAAPPATAAPSGSPSVSPSASPAPDPLDGLHLRTPGVRVVRRDGELAVTFDRGLFERDATLTRRGRATLRELGERLRPEAGRLAVAVIGHTDRTAVRPGGGYASNAELGMLRVTVVREVLSAAAGIPAVRFSTSTLAGALPPFPDGGVAPDDPRDRTVSMRISAAVAR